MTDCGNNTTVACGGVSSSCAKRLEGEAAPSRREGEEIRDAREKRCEMRDTGYGGEEMRDTGCGRKGGLVAQRSPNARLPGSLLRVKKRALGEHRATLLRLV